MPHYLTFGVQYVDGSHPLGKQVHPDGYVLVEEEDYYTARRAVVAAFGDRWSMLYAESDFLSKYHPRREIGRIHQGDDFVTWVVLDTANASPSMPPDGRQNSRSSISTASEEAVVSKLAGKPLGVIHIRAEVGELRSLKEHMDIVGLPFEWTEDTEEEACELLLDATDVLISIQPYRQHGCNLAPDRKDEE